MEIEQPAFGAVPVGSSVQPCPLAQKSKHWIEIELLGEDGTPIPWEKYMITLPDGSEVCGVLDRKGHARVDNIEEPGRCRVTFPRFDGESWSKSGGAPHG